MSERGHLIRGLFYVPLDERTVHMEKIVVSEHFRRKGVGDALMNELLQRMGGAGFCVVNTGFFRPEYLCRFDFRIQKQYAGLVRELPQPGADGAAASPLANSVTQPI